MVADGVRHVLATARRRAPLLLAGVSAVFVLLMGASPASAHATLLFTIPAVSSSVPSSPRQLTLVFDSPLSLPEHPIRLTNAAGDVIPLGTPATSRGSMVITVAVARALPTGAYTVDWQAVADDGDAITGSYQFGVGPDTASLNGSIGPGVSGTSGQLVTAAARWASFVSLAWLAGLIVFPRLVRGHSVDSSRQRSWATTATLTGWVASLVLLALVMGNGRVLNAFAHPRLGEVGSRPGLLALAEVVAYAVATSVAMSRRNGWMLVPLLAVVVAEAIRAHPQTYAAGWGELLTAIHLATAAVWFGTLMHVLRRAWARRGDPGLVRTVFARYARLALWLFATVVVTGTANALIVVPVSALATTSYGAVLLVKLALVASAAAFALAGRRRLRGRKLPLGAARLESLVLIVVLAVSAVLTVSAPPRPTSEALPFAPPPSGPVVPLGARAGQIGLSVHASAGQLVVVLLAPGAADRTPPGSVVQGGTAAPRSPRYRLAAGLTDPAGRTVGLLMRGCGPGCFAASLRWRAGTSRLTLQAEASGWTGGEAALNVPWPPQPRTEALARTVGSMKAIRRVVVYERVTSDTSVGPGQVKRIEVTGPEFLAAEPYGTGRATIVDTVPNKDNTATVLLGYPADNVDVDLTVDPSGRILRETLSTPNQLVTRAFDYRGE